MARKPGIGQAESDILRFIVDQQSATVGDVADHIAKTKGQSRNTAMTVMERLRAKGFLRRTKAEGVYRYAPVASKARVMEGLVSDFVEGVLGGSVSPLVAYLTNRVDVDEKQLRELKALVERLGDGSDEY